MQNWIYISDSEDQAFCASFGLSEEDALKLYDGVIGYTKFRLARDQARRTNKVSALPGSPSVVSKLFVLKGVAPWALATEVLKGQRDQVQGILDSVASDKKLKDDQVRQAQDARSRLETEIEAFAHKQPDFIEHPEAARARVRAEIMSQQAPR